MVLAALGDEYTEAQLANVMDSYEFGTPASRVTRLSKLSYTVQYGTFVLGTLQAALARGLFPIVFVKAAELPWADFAGFHTLVLVAATATEVWLHDPSLDNGPAQLDMDTFMLAWDEFDCLAAVISK
jgi:hypothetical protein